MRMLAALRAILWGKAVFAEASEAKGWSDVLSATAPVSPLSSETVANVSIKKSDDDEQIVYGEVYAPGVPDSQGDFMTVETIKEMAHEFLRKGFVSRIDTNHDQTDNGSYVVESFIARDDDPVFIPHSWVIGVKIPDPSLWALVKSGELNGFSLDGYGIRVPKTVEMLIPDVLTGMTDEADGHTHEFFVRFNDEGVFIGGYTSPGPDGHIHRILRGTATEVEKDHSHRFSFVEGVIHAEVAD